MTINWNSIKPLNNSQNSAFEELVCQLAREETIADRKEFYRIAAPDGGVEAYCVLNNGDEYGWQAKYFSSMQSPQWSQLTKSFKTALKKHPNLKKYYICIPLDRQDPRIDNEMWFMDCWNIKVKEWTKYAQEENREIEFEYWGSFELIYRLSQEKNAGRKSFWFSEHDFSDEWFRTIVERSKKDLGKRYTPELNLDLDLSKHFDAMRRNDNFRQNIKNHFDVFLTIIHKLANNLSGYQQFQSIISHINTALNNMEICFELSQKTELLMIDFDHIKKNAVLINEALFQCEETLSQCKDTLIEKKEDLNYPEYLIHESMRTLHEFLNFIESPTCSLANRPIMLLLGPAGIGKSHLLADISENIINTKKSCILLLGQHFSSEEAPWTQITNNLLRINCNEKELLGALSAKAESQRERILLLIDAINEGQGRFFWPDHIRGFINDCSKFPWIGLVLSIRSLYEKSLIPEDLISSNVAIKVTHPGFSNVKYKAFTLFLTKYGIEQPSIPLLHPEFSNPLFLKLLCEGLNRAGITRISKGYRGITNIINFFLDSVNKKLSSPSYCDYSVDLNLVRKVVNELIKYKITKKSTFIPYDMAFEIADKALPNFSNKHLFLDALISEGILSKNQYSLENKDATVVHLAYERFDDHLTTTYLLDTIDLTEESLIKCIDNHGSNQGILESLSIQIPERTGKELYEFLSDEKKAKLQVIEAFINSLIWRKPETINKKTLEYINNYILRNSYTFDLFLQIVYSVSSDPKHPYNANWLHNFLTQFSLADLDKNWTTYLHDKDYEDDAIQRTINWALSNDDKSYLQDESRLLASKAIAWIFSSTNIPLRDSATQALTMLLVNHINTITELLSEFDKVIDPYIYERILAAAYGAVLNSEKLDGIEKLSQHIIDRIFKQNEVYPNILVRDYARNIVEYAIYKEIFLLDNPEIIRPPYKSSWPTTFPSNKEIDAYKYEYDSESFKEYYQGQNSILSSMVTEYGRGRCNYGDFGRYTFQSALRNWDQFDPNDLSNYACKLIFEKYKYDVEKHGQFDIHSSEGNRHINSKERIGKKYQWIALYEILARISDNYKMHDRCGDEQEYRWFQGPWDPFVRNIDPTSLPPRAPFVQEKCWDKVEYSDWGGNHNDWLVSSEKLPDPEKIISISDSEWVILEKHLDWEEPVPIGEDKYRYPHKCIWYQIRSYLVSNDEANQLIEWANNQHFMGGWFPEERSSLYQIFSREYYWSPAYRFFNDPYYGRELWQEVKDPGNNNQVIGKVLPTAEGYLWETGSGDNLSYLAPREFIYTKMNLQYFQNPGIWLNNQGSIVCFDPSVDKRNSPYLIMRKDELSKFLQENNLSIFWVILGEKQINGNFLTKIKLSEWLELSGVYQLVNDKIHGSLRSFIYPNKNIKIT